MRAGFYAYSLYDRTVVNKPNTASMCLRDIVRGIEVAIVAIVEHKDKDLRYTREKGKSKMEDQVGLTLACLNIKKLVKWIGNISFYFALNQIFGWNSR